MNRLILAAALAVSVAACDNAAEEADQPAASASPAPSAAAAPSRAGTYEVTSADGTGTGTSQINPDGTYLDTIGDRTERGTWHEQADGKVCFDPEGDEAPTRCFTTTEPGPDGRYTATPDEGEPVTVRKVA